MVPVQDGGGIHVDGPLVRLVDEHCGQRAFALQGPPEIGAIRSVEFAAIRGVGHAVKGDHAHALVTAQNRLIAQQRQYLGRSGHAKTPQREGQSPYKLEIAFQIGFDGFCILPRHFGELCLRLCFDGRFRPVEVEQENGGKHDGRPQRVQGV